MHVLHQLRGEAGDEEEEDGVDEQVGEVEVLAVRVPLHLQVLLRQWVGQELHPAVHHHGLGKTNHVRVFVFCADFSRRSSF